MATTLRHNKTDGSLARWNTDKHGQMSNKSKSVPHAESQSPQSKTKTTKISQELFFSAGSVSRVSEANGRESFRVLPVSLFAMDLLKRKR